MAIEANITPDDGWFLGEDKNLVFTIYQADGVTPQNITGWALSYMLKRRVTDLDPAAVLTRTTALGAITLTTPLLGICTVSIPDDVSDPLVAQLYHHELKRTDAGSEGVLTYGTAEPIRGVHRT